MRVTTKKIDGMLHVTATIPHIDKNKGKFQRVSTEQLVEELRKKNIKHGRVQITNHLDNSDHSTRTAVWVFKLPETEAKKTPVAAKSKKTTKAAK